MKKNPTIAAIQLDTIACEVRHNVHKAMLWTRNAFEKGATFVVFHEGLTADYTPDPMRYGRTLDSAEVFGFYVLARQYNGYVALGLNEVWQDRPYISMVFVGPKGVAGVYRKSYLWPNQRQMSDRKFAVFLRRYVAHEQGYRLERGILGAGDGTTVIQVGGLRIGCLICADGSHPMAWKTFERNGADVIFWQTNCGNVSADDSVTRHARQLRTPIVATNRVGFSHGWFQLGGSVIAADDGSIVARANKTGHEELILADYADLDKLRRKK